MIRYIVLLALFLCIASPTQAQETTPETSTKWWWAWRETTQELIAFNAEGETNVIANFALGQVSRVNSDTALGVLVMDGEFALYKLTSESIVRLEGSYNGEYTDTLYFGLINFTVLKSVGTYTLVSGLDYAQLWIADLTNNSAAPLDMLLSFEANSCGYDMGGTLHHIESCVRFSEDGQFLRYVADPSPTNETSTFTLRERDLEAGIERNFYVPSSLDDTQYDSVGCEAGTYGVQWLCHRYSQYRTYDLSADWLVNLRGETRTLIEDTLSPVRWDIYFARDSLIVQDNFCQGGCRVDIYLPDLSLQQRFLLPEIEYLSVTKAVPLANAALLIYAGDGVYLLQDTGVWQRLGHIACCEALYNQSSDYRWIALVTDTDVTIVDLDARQPKFHLPRDIFPTMSYTDYGFVIANRWVYFEGEDELLELDINDSGAIIDMLPSRNLLYEQRYVSSETLEKGLYLYDPAAESYTLLVADATISSTN